MAKKILKLMTYNIHKGFNFRNKQFVLHQMREKIEHVNADLVMLQEVQGEHLKKQSQIDNWPSESQFEFLADKGWPHYAYGKNVIHSKGHHGNAILSKYPFIDWQNVNLTKHQHMSRSLLHAVIQLKRPKIQCHIICLHLGLTGAKRKKQLTTLYEHIDAHIEADEPLIIAGDFNDWRGQAEKILVNSFKLQEVFKTLEGEHARTFPTWFPALKIDRIYFRNLHPHAATPLCEEPWNKFSDHIPLYAEFQLL